MCVAYPARVVSVDPAVAEVGGALRDIVLIALDGDVAAGDWVLVHTGIAVARITEAEAIDLQHTLDEARRAIQ